MDIPEKSIITRISFRDARNNRLFEAHCPGGVGVIEYDPNGNLIFRGQMPGTVIDETVPQVTEAPEEAVEEKTAHAEEAAAKPKTETKKAASNPKETAAVDDEVSYEVDLDYNMEWEVETEPAEPDVVTAEEAEEEPYYEPHVPGAARAINKHLFVWVLNFVCGIYGVDRFFRGQTAMGVFKLLTFGGLGCWYLVDLIIAIVKAYGIHSDSEDLYFDVAGGYID
jgi:TM2 domain-containing membrane protein YozV